MNIPNLACLRDRIELTDALSRSELADLHFDWEVGFADAIKRSRRASEERTLLFHEAYQGLNNLLRAMRARDGRDLDAPMGFASNSIPRICELIGPPSKSVLDVGCGTGALVIALIGRGYDACGIDISTDLVIRGRSMLAKERPSDPEKRPEKRLMAGDFLRHDFGGNTFDFIFSNDVLEHIHPDEASNFLEKCFRLLRPSGSLCLVTPNRFTGPGDASILRLPRGSPPVGLHLREYSLNDLWRLLKESGFHEVSSRLYCDGRGRKGTQTRAVYARLKKMMEPCFAVLPAVIRARMMGFMSYSEVVAAKRLDGASLADHQTGD